MNTRNKHLIGIDLLRFFAAFAVMAYHYIYLTASPGWSIHTASQSVVTVLESAPSVRWGWIGVEIFFVVSGFVIALTAQHATPFKFIVSRITRLGPAVWICAPITFLVCKYGLDLHPFYALLRSVFFSPFGPWVDGVYWTLGIEIAFYSLILILISCRRFNYITLLAIILGAISAMFWMFVAVIWLSSPDSREPLLKLIEARELSLLLIHHGVFFSIGVAIWLNTQNRTLGKNWLILFIAGACLEIFFQNESINARVILKFDALLPMMIWAIAMMVLIWSINTDKLDTIPTGLSASCRTLGLMTYPLYLIHQINGAYLMGWLIKKGAAESVAIGITMALAVLASWVVAKALEPPLQSLTKRLLQLIPTYWAALNRK